MNVKAIETGVTLSVSIHLAAIHVHVRLVTSLDMMGKDVQVMYFLTVLVIPILIMGKWIVVCF